MSEKSEMDYLDELITCLRDAKNAIEPIPEPENFAFHNSPVEYRWTTIARTIRIFLNDAITMRRDWKKEETQYD